MRNAKFTEGKDLIAVAGTMVRPLEPEINQHNVPILISIVDKTVVYNGVSSRLDDERLVL